MDKLMELKTSNSLIDALKSATSRKQTAAEIQEQRVSFIFGSIKEKNGVTRTRIQEVLMEQQGIGS